MVGIFCFPIFVVTAHGAFVFDNGTFSWILFSANKYPPWVYDRIHSSYAMYSAPDRTK